MHFIAILYFIFNSLIPTAASNEFIASSKLQKECRTCRKFEFQIKFCFRLFHILFHITPTRNYQNIVTGAVGRFFQLEKFENLENVMFFDSYTPIEIYKIFRFALFSFFSGSMRV